MEYSTDITENFDILDEYPIFVDEPLEGFLCSKNSGDLFAFRSFTLIPELLWHWVLIPVASVSANVKDAFASAASTPPDRWMSIVEDRRGGQPQLSAAWMEGRRPLPATSLDR
jgi:hypothetical protein